MRFLSWCATLGIVGTAIAGAAGCTTTVNSGDAGPDLFGDSGTTNDGSTTNEDAATTTEDGGSDAQASCGALSFDNGGACDTCAQTNCCSDLAACDTADSSGLNDAGLTGCEQILDCAFSFCMTPAADGGAMSLDECLSTCNGSYPAAQQQTAGTLVTCVSTHCATECGG